MAASHPAGPATTTSTRLGALVGRRASAARCSWDSAGLMTHCVRWPLNIHQEMHSLTARQRRTRDVSPRRVFATGLRMGELGGAEADEV
jgi:hypothetical protein